MVQKEWTMANDSSPHSFSCILKITERTEQRDVWVADKQNIITLKVPW